MVDIEIAINFTINDNICKEPFEVLLGKNIPLFVDLLLSRESSINPQAYKFASKMKQLGDKVKSAIHNA